MQVAKYHVLAQMIFHLNSEHKLKFDLRIKDVGPVQRKLFECEAARQYIQTSPEGPGKCKCIY